MKKGRFFCGTVIALITVVFMFVTCDLNSDSDVPNPSDFTSGTVITLNLDEETAGAINSSNGEQWFKFTATTSTQYIIIRYDTMTDAYIQLYDKNGGTVGERTYCSLNPPYGGTFLTRSVTKGQVYYIKVTPGSKSGTYRILFSNSVLTVADRMEATPLVANTWTAGISTVDDNQLFKFTASAITQRIHIQFGTLTDMMVRIYDSTGDLVGGVDNDQHLTGNRNTTKYISQALMSGQVYYISVWPYSKTGSGTYWIAFNTSQEPPTSTQFPSGWAEANTLSANVWANGSVPTNNWGQCFKFTATANTQYVHAGFFTLSKLDVRLYDRINNTIGDYITLSDSKSYTIFSVTIGKEYYIEVTPVSGSESGTYKIMFNTSNTIPE